MTEEQVPEQCHKRGWKELDKRNTKCHSLNHALSFHNHLQHKYNAFATLPIIIQESSPTISLVILCIKAMCSLRCDLLMVSEDLQPSDLPMQVEHGPTTFYVSNFCPEPLAAVAAMGRPQEQALQCIHCSPSGAPGLDHPVVLWSVTSTSAFLPGFCFFHLSFRIGILAPMALRWKIPWGSQSYRGHW